MIRKLTMQDKEEVLKFAYQKERENLFVLGSFDIYEDPFKENIFWGFFDEGKMTGLATFFSRFGNLVVNTVEIEVIDALVDEAVKSGVKPKVTACFANYAKRIIERLEKHGIAAKKVGQEVVYTLAGADFVDFSGGDGEIASEKDVDEIARFNVDQEWDDEVTDEARQKIFPSREFIVRVDGKIVSKANIHGVSKNYFQIGGVGTLPSERRKGYAAKAVSFLCKTHFAKGVGTAILFTGVDNNAARKLYEKIGFRPAGEFIIAEF